MLHPVCPYKMTVLYPVVRAYHTLQILVHCISNSLLWKTILLFLISVLLLSRHTVHLSFDAV